MYSTEQSPPRVAVFHPYEVVPSAKKQSSARSIEAALAEAVNLTEALGVEVVFSATAPLKTIHPKHFIGRGKAEEWKAQCQTEEVEAVLMNVDLSPTQHRHLEEALGCKVMDRTGVILEIFATRARTKSGRIQVELAQVEYQLSRLVRAWTHLERQRGGLGKTGGPGERQLEIDRRLLRDRAKFLREKLKTLHQQRQVQRKARSSRVPQVALVGYTNAGKSTLFQTLTQQDAGAADMLFATLDPLTREMKLPNGMAVTMSDTVGFISGLPHQLVDAFQSTLEEVALADVILHIHDIENEDFQAQTADVEAVLAEIGAEKVPRLHVANKCDKLSTEERALRMAELPKGCISASALTGAGKADVLFAVQTFLSQQHITLNVVFPVANGAAYAYLHQHGTILQETVTEEDPTNWHIHAHMPEQHWKKLTHMLWQQDQQVCSTLAPFLPPAPEPWEVLEKN